MAGRACVQCTCVRNVWKSMQNKNRTRLFSDSVSWIKWTRAISQRRHYQCKQYRQRTLKPLVPMLCCPKRKKTSHGRGTRYAAKQEREYIHIPKNTHVNNFSQVTFASLPSPPQLHTGWALITMLLMEGAPHRPPLTIQYAPDSSRESGAFLKKAGALTYLRLRISSASFLICSGKGWERTRTARPLSSTSKL